VAILELSLSQQRENVRVEQSRNVRLTRSGWVGGRKRRSVDDPGRSRPAGGIKKAAKGLITRGQAALELKISERQVYRSLAAMEKDGDEAVIIDCEGDRPIVGLVKSWNERQWRLFPIQS
jgi:hypothetical protein